MAAKFNFKKSKNNHNPFPLETLHERYSKEKALNPQSNYTVEKIDANYFSFKPIEQTKGDN
ncbi:hypothetical protein ACFFIX_08290 [Metabacillus herbersteinensis]|uniref:Uncharacterized protein n=1 Tax=Metabacillus herbersteinensis TaxID=283816 RepID=A0ABV6GEW4_9BACI